MVHTGDMMFVDVRSANSVFDFEGNRIELDPFYRTHAYVADIISVKTYGRHYKSQFEWHPILILSSGKVVRSRPYFSDLEEVVNHASVLDFVGLTPYIDMDPFMEECFEVGYTSIDVGPRSYGGCFGATGTYEKGREPRVDGWPAIWRIAEKYDISWGCGGHHTRQLINFKPTGKYEFGNHKAP